jgi:hypothetical protein
VTSDDQIVLVTLTRSEFNAFGIGIGSTVWVRTVPGAPTVAVTAKLPVPETVVDG